MTKKIVFVNKCLESLSKYFSVEGAKASIDVMNRLKLKNIKDTEDVPIEVAGNCKETLYQRIKMLKGEDSANKFIEEVRNL